MSSAAPEYVFATPFLNPPASPIRSLMPYAMRPGTISLAGGYPAQELFDVDGLSIAWATVEHLHEVNRCRGLFATHFHELTVLSEKHFLSLTTNPYIWREIRSPSIRLIQ